MSDETGGVACGVSGTVGRNAGLVKSGMVGSLVGAAGVLGAGCCAGDGVRLGGRTGGSGGKAVFGLLGASSFGLGGSGLAASC